jgi:hypothetical protein
MAQLTNGHAINIYNKLLQYKDKQIADEFAEKLPLSKSATFERKFKWAEKLCEFLECNFTEDEIKEFRMICSCSPSEKEMETTRRIFTKAADINEFVINYNQEYAGHHSVWCDESAFYFSYPACYCSCVKRMDKTLSKTWCLCTLGYTKKLFDFAFDCDADVELVESIKLGNNRCVMKITDISSK